MPPRKTTDFGALFEALVEDLRIQVAAAIDRTLSNFDKRLVRLERRIEQLDPNHASLSEERAEKRGCALCARRAVARGLCSAHYQQWRYRERKQVSNKSRSHDVDPRLLLNPLSEVSADN
jgi:hypothetical protein